MARPKSELLSYSGIVFEITKAIVNEVLDLGGTDEDLRKVLKDKNLCRKIAELLVQSKSAIVATFHVVVDYSKSLQEMVSEGCYDWVNNEITPEHFSVEGDGQQEKDIVLFHFGRYISSEDAIVEMEKEGYRPARIEDLLALGASQPEIQKQFPIVALGSVWRHPDGHRHVSFLDWDGLGRRLYLAWFGLDWNDAWRFAAVRK